MKEPLGTLIVFSVVCLIAGHLLPVWTGWEIKGVTPRSSIWIVVIVNTLGMLFIWGVTIQKKRAYQLFCKGIATMGRVSNVTKAGSAKSKYAYYHPR